VNPSVMILNHCGWKHQIGKRNLPLMVGVNAIADGVITGPEGSHKNWLAEKVKEGWVYGPEKDPEAKEHPCCVPFEELSEEMQFKDILFFDTVTSLINSTRTFKNRLQAETGKDA
jgi:hypothetical protein